MQHCVGDTTFAALSHSTIFTCTTSSSLHRIAGNFRGCKFSRKCLQTLQKKFSWFLFSWGVPAVPHPSYVLTYTTSRDTRWVKIFVVFIFAVPCRSAKTAKICTPRKFPAIRYLLHFTCVCARAHSTGVYVYMSGVSPAPPLHQKRRLAQCRDTTSQDRSEQRKR